jgi:aryl-alcohol dehydrogenase-like predicted oxidoreductase
MPTTAGLATPSIRTVELPSGERIPALGQGTWHMGEDPRRRPQEIAALRLGLDLGLTLVDTAEMYADGLTEELIGEALAGRRDDAFLVSKLLPMNATRRGTVVGCGGEPGALQPRVPRHRARPAAVVP